MQDRIDLQSCYNGLYEVLNMQTSFESITIKNYQEMLEVFDLLVNLFNESEVELISNSFEFDSFSYFFIKSHRSSVTEGNTTSDGEFTQLVIENVNDNEEYVVPDKIHDETYEIVNLKKVYEYLKNTNRYTRRELQRAHAIIGEKIFKNNLMMQRGKLKTKNNHVPFNHRGSMYIKVFSRVENVREELDSLFSYWNNLPEEKPAQVFAKFIILQIEIISIHPFNDGNGRVARAFSESYFESKGYTPYTPYSIDHKRYYQDAMGEFSILSRDSIMDGYLSFASFILNSYTFNVNELLESISKLEYTIKGSD